MPFFLPRDCSIDLATPYWLLAALALLIVAALALVVQSVTLWRRESQVGATRWARLPLALPLLWAAICGLLAVQAYGFYRDVTTPLVCGPTEICNFKGLCMPAAELGSFTEFALVAAALLLGVGWLALVRLKRRIQRA
jgi:hypothetical protein